jgi:RNA polymerase sigma-70 factor (ECF subfamily)
VDLLFRAAWALCGSREDAEDLVQETCARVIARPRRLRHGNEAAYLLRALRNTFLSTQRQRSYERHPFDLRDESVADLEDPIAVRRPEQAAEANEVYRAIAGLPPHFRDAVVLVDVSGLTYGEAARALGLRPTTLASRVFRGRAQVVRTLEAPQSREAARLRRV